MLFVGSLFDRPRRRKPKSYRGGVSVAWQVGTQIQSAGEARLGRAFECQHFICFNSARAKHDMDTPSKQDQDGELLQWDELGTPIGAECPAFLLPHPEAASATVA